jgi:bacteriorhodopsin
MLRVRYIYIYMYMCVCVCVCVCVKMVLYISLHRRASKRRSKMRLKCVIGFFIFVSYKNSSDLIVLLSHRPDT